MDRTSKFVTVHGLVRDRSVFSIHVILAKHEFSPKNGPATGQTVDVYKIGNLFLCNALAPILLKTSAADEYAARRIFCRPFVFSPHLSYNSRFYRNRVLLETQMPNIAAVLKEEIRRLARKEVRLCTSTTKQAVAQYRRDIAKLKRLIQAQQKRLAFFASQSQGHNGQPQSDDNALTNVRYSARSVRAQRARLGLSAEDYGRLVGVSGLTVYHWEHGRARPRQAQLAALIAVRGIGKREALTRLAALKQEIAKGRRRKATRR